MTALTPQPAVSIPASPTALPDRPPDLALAAMFEASTDLSLTLGQGLFLGPVRASTIEQGSQAIPSLCVFCLVTGGEAPTRTHAHGDEMLYASVNVYVRSDPQQFESGQKLGRLLWRTIQTNVPVQYQETQCLTSEPQYSGEDDQQRHIWTIPVRLTYTGY